ncbi:MAG: hypothetical protein ACKVHR_08810 [Pirellulales bacterium]|jgi:hypothetical protein
MRHSHQISLLATAVLIAVSLAAITGCSLDMDAPANGVQIKIDKPVSKEVQETWKKMLKANLDEGQTSSSTVSVNGKSTFNYSPVADPQAYADKIDFAKVVKIEGNVIWLEELDVQEN